jgi:tRNA threonylcarbamoyladenosine biosynthesis protein TsaE
MEGYRWKKWSSLLSPLSPKQHSNKDGGMGTLICKKLSQLDEISRNLLNHFPDQRVFGFTGQMGAGKTTLIKSFCKVLGVVDVVNSPTFSIINEYKTGGNESIYHFDFFRLAKSEELYDIGYEDYLYSGHYCLIEWPEKFEELLPDNFVYIQIDVNEIDQSRIITF